MEQSCINELIVSRFNTIRETRQTKVYNTSRIKMNQLNYMIKGP